MTKKMQRTEVTTAEKVRHLRLNFPEMTYREIAAETGVSFQRVDQICIKLNLSKPRENHIKEVIQAAKANPLFNFQEIADIVGVSASRVYGILKQAGKYKKQTQEMKAFRATGHRDWVKCRFCFQWGSKKELYFNPMLDWPYSRAYHRECNNEAYREYRQRKKLKGTKR